MNTSPTSTQASNGPCLAFIAVIFDIVRESCDRGEPIARLKGMGVGVLDDWLFAGERVGEWSA
jgi:hypothetical protein